MNKKKGDHHPRKHQHTQIARTTTEARRALEAYDRGELIIAAAEARLALAARERDELLAPVAAPAEMAAPSAAAAAPPATAAPAPPPWRVVLTNSDFLKGAGDFSKGLAVLVVAFGFAAALLLAVHSGQFAFATKLVEGGGVAAGGGLAGRLMTKTIGK